MKYDRTSRRMFLQSSGGFLIAIPFLPSLFGRSALAADGISPMKYVQIMNLQGPVRESTLPGNGKAIAQQDIGGFAKLQKLSNVINDYGQISKIFGTEWNEISQYLNLISNYHAYNSSTLHNTCIATTGGGVYRDNPRAAMFPYSVDYILQKELNLENQVIRTDFDRSGVYQNFSFDGSKDSGGTPRTISSLNNFDALKSLLVTPSCGTSNPQVDNSKLTLQKSILNGVMEDYNKVKNNRWLSKVDRERFSNHVDSVNDLFGRIQESESNVEANSNYNNAELCNNPPTTSGANYRTKHENALDIIALGLATGQWRIAAHTIKAAGDNNIDYASIHGVHHNNRSAMDDIIIWRSKIVAHFISTLAKTTDVNGEPLIKSTMVYWGSEYADTGNGDPDGAAHQIHSYTGLLAGTANGKLNTGNHIDAGGAPVGRLLITIFKAMGLSSSQYERDGVRGFGTYDTASGNQAFRYGKLTTDRANFFVSQAERRKGLPIVSNWETDS